MESKITIFKDIFSKEPKYISVDSALERIKTGKSKERIESIRSQMDKERASKMKQNLPSVCFSGTFSERKDEFLLEHSGLIVLDFDGIDNPEEYRESLKEYRFIYSAWVSPSGNGVKALVKVASGDKHQAHFNSLMEDFDNLDASGRNVSRVCYESYDPDIWVNKKVIQYRKFKKEEKVKVEEAVGDKLNIFENIKRWLSNKGDAFVKGERNIFIFKLASACCRFGLDDSECYNFSSMSFSDSTFSDTELRRTIDSAYRANADSFATAEFTNGNLVDKVTRGEVKTKDIDPEIYNIDVKPKDVIFGEDVKGGALSLYRDGYEKIEGIGVPEFDYHYKIRKGELTILTGIGNYGKSTLMKWFMVMRMIKFGDKFALFSPEDNPAEEFYNDLVEVLVGGSCTPDNPSRPSEDEYKKAYDFISDHVFYVYPETIAPTPNYIKERFLELIIKEAVDHVIIDPWNQLHNDYKAFGNRDDKYLEFMLSDFHRFSQVNNIGFIIVAHPKLASLDSSGNYPIPNVYSLQGGSTWNAKSDNILVYHRPEGITNPQSPVCEFHSKKIRRQKVVGKKGMVSFTMNFAKRRFYFGGRDYMEELITGTPSKGEMIVPETFNSQAITNAVSEESFNEEIDFDGANFE